jgi:hypothetical protein
MFQLLHPYFILHSFSKKFLDYQATGSGMEQPTHQFLNLDHPLGSAPRVLVSETSELLLF